MKQKTAIVAAFMHSPEILILDEPTTGLDPLMRDAFITLIKEEKAKGTTIIMSNHMFDELEETCDYVAFIKDGHIMDIVDMDVIRNSQFRDYVITFVEKSDYESLNTKDMDILSKDDDELSIAIRIDIKNTASLIKQLGERKIKSVVEKKHTLEEFFLEGVGGKKDE